MTTAQKFLGGFQIIRQHLWYTKHNPTHLDYLAQDIIQLTGGKPWFVQMICHYIWQNRGDIIGYNFEQLWKRSLKDQVERQSSRSHLAPYYESIDEQTRKILGQLSISRTLTISQLARKTNLPKGEITKTLKDLERLNKVKRQSRLPSFENNCYRFADSITKDWWRERTAGAPKSFPWRLFRLVMIGILLIGIVFQQYYTHPRLEYCSVQIPESLAEVWYPVSIEPSEKGSLRVIVSNRETSSTAPITVTLQVNSDSINYRYNGSNMIQISQLKPGEKREYELEYLVHPLIPKSGAITNVTLVLNNNTLSSEFLMQRRLPIKQYFLPIASLVTIALAYKD